MSEQSNKMKRREFIRRMGLTTGSVLLSPFIDTMISQAWGAEITKKRFVVYMHGGSLFPSFTKTGGTETNFTLTPAMTALEPYKKDLLILRNIYNTVYPDLHGNLYGTLSGVPCLGVPPTDEEAWRIAQPGGPTIDTILSNELGKDTRVKEMVLGYVFPGQTGLAYGAKSVKTPIQNLSEAFSTYFTGISNPPPTNNQSLQKKNVLDFAAGDIKRAYRGLASSEKAKLDEYLNSITSIGASLGNVSTPMGANCTAYRVPATIQALTGETYKTLPTYPSFDGLPTEEGYNYCGNALVQADMIGLGLTCGVARHASMVSVQGQWHQNYPELGIDFDTHGGVYHLLDDNGDGNATVRANAMKILNFHASVVARIYDRLKKTPEGNGTAADNTVILWCSDTGGSHHNGWNNASVMLLGNAGGALNTGRSITYNNNQYSMCEVLLTIAKAMGSTVTTIGNGTNPGKNPIPGLLA